MGEPSLRGKVALVTGASRGIGQAIAYSLAEAGADLILTSTRPGGTTDTETVVSQRFGRRVLGMPCDVSVPSQVDALVQQALTTFGSVELLVNNAGTLHWGRVDEQTDEAFERVLRVNLSGPFFLIRRLLPQMLHRRTGRIINVSSISGTLGTPRLSSYCASKWGLNGLTKSLAEELRDSGVGVFGVMPGSVDTDMLKGSPFTPAMKPEAIADVVRYLCTEAPLAMNGSLTEVFG